VFRRGALRSFLATAAVAILGRPAGALAQPPFAEPSTPSAVQDYQRAAEFLRQGSPDEATYWFYRGQLRFRIYLLAHPEEPPDRGRALFSSFQEVIGGPVNRYAFGDIPALVKVYDQVLAWHAANDEPSVPKALYPAAHEQARSGLERLRDRVIAERDGIREQRTKNGLPNRT